MTDPFAPMKAAAAVGWGGFAPLEVVTMRPAARLVRFAGVKPGDRVLDACCGTGVVAVSAARAGAQVTGLDLAPALLEHARWNAQVAGVAVDLHEGDVEALPFPDASFDVVLSQFGHIFAPRPDVAIGELLRVLRPGGTIAFSTWPPDEVVGQMFDLNARYLPPPPGAGRVAAWGDPEVIRARLGDAVSDLTFELGESFLAALSPAHYRQRIESTGPAGSIVDRLDAATLAGWRAELEALIGPHIEDNMLRQVYRSARATKRPT